MADLGLNPKVVALRNARTPAEFVKALYDLALAAGGSDTTPLNAAALLNEDAILPIGAMLNYTGGTVPTGYLLADGSTASKAAYPDLAGKLKTTWGPETSTHFTLPDTRRRVVIGFGSTDESLNSNAPDPEIGSYGGHESKTLTLAEIPRHRHGAGSMTGEAAGGHTHSLSRGIRSFERVAALPWPSGGSGFGYTQESGRHEHEMTGITDWTGSASPTAFPLYTTCVVVDKIIRT